MFWFFPFLQGRDLDYREYFAAMVFCIALLVAFLCSFLALLTASLTPKLQTCFGTQICFWAYQIGMTVASVGVTVAVVTFSMFDFVPVYVTILPALGLMGWRFLQWCRDCHAGENSLPGEGMLGRAIRTLTVMEMNRPVEFYGLLILVVLVGVVFPVVSEGLCICYYNPDMGVVIGSSSLSTRLTRILTMPESCPSGPPCHVYLTLPDDSSHFLFLNAHTSPHYDSLTVHYGLQPTALNYSLPMTQFPVEGLEHQNNRHVFSLLLANLTSNTRYYLRLEYLPGIFSQQYWFQTLPEATEAPFRFVAGGDIGNTGFAYTISQRAGEQGPAVGFVGGDLAYDNNFRTCARTWDLLLRQWTLLSTDSTQLIPLVFSLGNHDVGVESLSGKALPVGSMGPLYFLFFPQHFPRDENGNVEYRLPNVAERMPYFRHSIGLCSFYTLDSGYVANYTGAQLAWLKATLPTDTAQYKFAQYHLPIYPSLHLDPDETLPSGEALKYWVPLFDQYRFTVVFENHEHSFKRTVPLTCSMEDPQGVVYVGDGQWGAGSQTTPNPGFEQDPDIFLKEGLNFHVWVGEITETQAKFTAIGLNPGDIVDSFTISS